MKLSSLFTDASKWTQGGYAKNAEGTIVDPLDETAQCFCIAGGVMRSQHPTQWNMVILKITNHLKIEYKDIAKWNDDPARTFEDVQKAIQFVENNG